MMSYVKKIISAPGNGIVRACGARPESQKAMGM